MLLGIRPYRAVTQGEAESRAFFNLAFGPDASSVAANDAPNRGEAYSRSLELSRLMHALEGPKKLIDIGHVKAGAVIANAINGLTVFARYAELYPRMRML